MNVLINNFLGISDESIEITYQPIPLTISDIENNNKINKTIEKFEKREIYETDFDIDLLLIIYKEIEVSDSNKGRFYLNISPNIIDIVDSLCETVKLTKCDKNIIHYSKYQNYPVFKKFINFKFIPQYLSEKGYNLRLFYLSMILFFRFDKVLFHYYYNHYFEICSPKSKEINQYTDILKKLSVIHFKYIVCKLHLEVDFYRLDSYDDDSDNGYIYLCPFSKKFYLIKDYKLSRIISSINCKDDINFNTVIDGFKNNIIIRKSKKTRFFFYINYTQINEKRRAILLKLLINKGKNKINY